MRFPEKNINKTREELDGCIEWAMAQSSIRLGCIVLETAMGLSIHEAGLPGHALHRETASQEAEAMNGKLAVLRRN